MAAINTSIDAIAVPIIAAISALSVLLCFMHVETLPVFYNDFIYFQFGTTVLKGIVYF